MRISDWSSDVCSSDLRLKASYVTSLNLAGPVFAHRLTFAADWERESFRNTVPFGFAFTGRRSTRNVGLVGEYALAGAGFDLSAARSEEHTSELQSLMRISYAVFCLKKKIRKTDNKHRP